MYRDGIADFESVRAIEAGKTARIVAQSDQGYCAPAILRSGEAASVKDHSLRH